MNPRGRNLLTVLSLGLFACTRASTPAATPAVADVAPVDGGKPIPAAATPRTTTTKPIPLTLANVVKQVAPRAKTAVVFGRKEAVLELAAFGIAAEYAGPEVWPSGCVPDNTNPNADLVVADQAPLNPWDRADSFLPHVCGMRDVLLVAHARGQLHDISDDRHGRIFVDANCTEACDTYRIESGLPNHWFSTGGLPLTLYGERFGWMRGSAVRSAKGVVIGGALELGGDPIGRGGHGKFRIDVAGAAFASSKPTHRDALVGWFGSDVLSVMPAQVNGLAQVTGSYHLDGAIVGDVHGNWAPIPGAPPRLLALDGAGTISTMTAPHVDWMIDGPALVQLDAEDDAARKQAAALLKANDPAPAAPLRPVYEHMKALKVDTLGRGSTLGTAIEQLGTFETHANDPLVLARALDVVDSEYDRELRTDAHRELAEAMFSRVCALLGPVAEGPNVAAARHANGVLWYLYDRHGDPHDVQPLFRRLRRKFGPPTPDKIVKP